MDSKKNNLLSNVMNRLGGKNEDPYAVSEESWKRLQNDKDMDVLRLDDDIPAAPVQSGTGDVELTLGSGTPEPDPLPAGPVRPALNLGDEISSHAGTPEPQTRPELTLTPELEIKPELTLEPDPESVLNPEPNPFTGNADGSLEMHYAKPERPAENPDLPGEEPGDADLFADGDESGQDGGEKSGRGWKLPKFSLGKLPFGKKQKEDDFGEGFPEEEYPDEGTPEDLPEGQSSGPKPPQEPVSGSAPAQQAPSREEPEEGNASFRAERPEDEDYEFDDEGTGAVKAILGSAGTMAAGIGMGLVGIFKVIGRFIRDAFLAAFTAIGAYLQHELRRKNLKNLFSRYLLAFVILYYELVLKFSTTGKPLGFALLYIFLFSVCWGLAGYLLTTILRPAVNRNARKVLILILAIPYLVNYYRFRQAGEFLGLSDTMPVTAKSMIGVIFSLPGLAHLALFLIPFLLYTFLLCYVDKAKRIKARRRIRTVAVILMLWFVTWLLILANGNYRWAYSKEYSYGTAVSDFGLLNTMRLDVLMKIRGDAGRHASLAPAAGQPAEEDESMETDIDETAETEETDDGFVDPLDEQMNDIDGDLEEADDEGMEEEEQEAPAEEGQPVVSNDR